MQHGSRKGFYGGSQKIIGVYIWRLEPIFEHGLQFRFNEITYFLEHLFIGYAVLKWSNLEFTFEVGGSLVAADAMFLEPCHTVIHAKILTGINRENFAVKN